jgi:hypothetical protein
VTGGGLDLDDTCVDDADTPRPAQANDRPLLNHDVCLPSDNNTDGYNQDPTEVVQFLEHDGTPLVSHHRAYILQAHADSSGWQGFKAHAS